MMLWIAHRGASAEAPENTMAAFRLARQHGVHGFEFDLQRCASGEIVLFHDWVLSRTSDHMGDKGVSDLTLTQLRTLDVGKWKAARFAGERIATLEEVFEFVNSREFLDIEIKVRGLRSRGIENGLLAALEKYKIKNCAVSSFNPWVLRRFKKLAPDIPMGLISEEKAPLMRNRRFWVWMLRPQYLFIQYHERLEADVRWAKKRGIKVMVWTVDDIAHVEHCAALGVEGVISNRADLLGRMPPSLRARFSSNA